jgi:hypothetical protein
MSLKVSSTTTEEPTSAERAAGIDPATELLKAIEAGDNTVSLMRGMLWGMLAIAVELRGLHKHISRLTAETGGIRIAVEEISEAMLYGSETETTEVKND